MVLAIKRSSVDVIPEDYEPFVVLPDSNSSITNCKNELISIGIQKKSPFCLSNDGKHFCLVNSDYSIMLFEIDQFHAVNKEIHMSGHKQSVSCLLFHPSLPILYSSGPEGIFVWDSDSGNCIQEWSDCQSSTSAISCLSLLCNGSILCAGSIDGSITVFNTTQPLTEIVRFSAHHSSIRAIAYSEPLSILITTSHNEIHLWHFVAPSITYITGLEGQLGDVLCLTLSQDGKTLFSGAADNRVKLWDLERCRYLRDVLLPGYQSPHRGNAIFLSTALDANQLLSVCLDGSFRVFRVNEPMERKPSSFSGYEELMSGSELLEMDTSSVFDELVAEGSLPSDIISTCAYSPSSHLLGVVSESFLYLASFDFPKLKHSSISSFYYPTSSIVGLRGFRQSNGLIGASSDGYLFTLEASACLSTFFVSLTTSIYSMSLWNHFVFLGCADYKIHTFYTAKSFYDGEVIDIHQFEGNIGKIRALDVSPKCEMLASGCEDGSLCVYALPAESVALDETTRSFPVAVMDDHDGMVLSIAFGDQEDFSYLASGGSDYALMVYKVQKGVCKRWWKEENAHLGTINCIIFGKHSTGELLFTGGSDATIRIWNVPHEELIGELKCHAERILAMAVSEDGNYLASTAEDGKVILWDLQNGFSAIRIYEKEDVCEALVLDGNRLVCGYRSGTILVWQ